jgi:hypothetical protein
LVAAAAFYRAALVGIIFFDLAMLTLPASAAETHKILMTRLGLTPIRTAISCQSRKHQTKASLGTIEIAERGEATRTSRSSRESVRALLAPNASIIFPEAGQHCILSPVMVIFQNG